MPRLSRQQKEQTIGPLHAGKAARVIANDLNWVLDICGNRLTSTPTPIPTGKYQG